MEAVGLLLLLMIGVSHGLESFCDGRQDGAQCFGGLGGTVNIQLMDDVSKINRFELTKEKSVILKWINNKIISNTIADRSSFSSSNGTFRITNLNKEDSGQYELQTFNSNGSSTGIRTLQFTVQAGVSSVQLVSECLSEGQKEVSCSSEGGDSPQYSWTLDGHTLTDSELVSGNNQTNIIVLRRNISGRLICSVRNQVSVLNNETFISTCEFINCTSNGTHISGWVFKENNTLCDEPATNSPVGVESFCDGRQDGAQCFGALGGTVNIQLMDDVSKINRFELIKNKSVILRWINIQIISNTIADRSSFSSSNGMFRITNLNKEDSGQYELWTFDSNGSSTGISTFQFTVEAGVSSVQLVSECLSEGQKKVSCSSEGGDSPQYSWTLDGHTLTDSELVSGNNQTNIIVLRRNISGRLICSVRNQVSESFKEEIISTCEFINCTFNGTHISGWVFKENNTLCDEPTTNSPVGPSHLLLLGLRALLVFLPLIIICLCFTWKKKKTERSQKAADPENSVMMVEVRSSGS